MWNHACPRLTVRAVARARSTRDFTSGEAAPGQKAASARRGKFSCVSTCRPGCRTSGPNCTLNPTPRAARADRLSEEGG